MKNGDTAHPYSVDANAVCQQVGISADTLYAYVSRGLIRKIPHPQDGRKSLYHQDDLAALKIRKFKGRSRKDVAASTISWGEPVLQSAITKIRDQHLFYRGHNATELAKNHDFEHVFALLVGEKFKGVAPLAELDRLLLPKGWSPIQRLTMMLAFESGNVGSKGGLQTARRLLRQAALVVADIEQDDPSRSIAQLVSDKWSANHDAASIIEQALILCADHELNASTYAARVAASAGANLPAALLAGAATLSGDLHGGMTDRTREWVDKFNSTPVLEREKLAPQNAVPPGFGHPLYTNGDPRALALMNACGRPDDWEDIAKFVLDRTRASPTLDFGLAMVEVHLNLPRGCGLGIFALGRMAGWIAHIFEQRKKGKLIRPRAVFSGQRSSD
ncbi:citrate synthase [Maritalea sp.]|uniref:citrate synthase n=1 Tax=Maritalea sp. TaxID=2003361 RepID=UPI003EF5EA95